jgi:hypothetical protein
MNQKNALKQLVNTISPLTYYYFSHKSQKNHVRTIIITTSITWPFLKKWYAMKFNIVDRYMHTLSFGSQKMMFNKSHMKSLCSFLQH